LVLLRYVLTTVNIKFIWHFFLHQCFFVHHGNTFKYFICMHWI
jgi:hypothetical protein